MWQHTEKGENVVTKIITFNDLLVQHKIGVTFYLHSSQHKTEDETVRENKEKHLLQ